MTLLAVILTRPRCELSVLVNKIAAKSFISGEPCVRESGVCLG